MTAVSMRGNVVIRYGKKGLDDEGNKLKMRRDNEGGVLVKSSIRNLVIRGGGEGFF